MTLDTSLSRLDADAVQVEFRRVAYDVEKAARAVETSRLPDAYAEALRVAR